MFLQWVRPAVFAAGLTTNIEDDLARTEQLSVGGQVDFRIVLFSYMPFTISVGYAAVFDEFSDPTTEFMFSLKIL